MLWANNGERVDRMSLGMLVTIGLLAIANLVTTVSARADGSGADRSPSFSAAWDWVQLSARLFNGPATQENRLTLQGRIEVLDSNGLHGMYVSEPNILQASDSSGKPIEWQAVPSRHVRSFQRLMHRYVLRPIEWAELLDSGRLTDLTWTRDIYPFDVSLQLLIDPNTVLPASFSLLKWSVLGLYAEHIIEVDVPFVASEQWQEVAPGLRILVRYAGLERGETQYMYITEVEYLNGSLGAFSDELVEGEGLADYIVLESLLVPIDSQGNPLPEWMWPPRWSDSATRTSRETVLCSGRRVGTDPSTSFRIRHIIVVHPVEVEIPFEWTNIPLPAFQTRMSHP